MIGWVYLWVLVVMTTFITTVSGFRCKWSNEGCTSEMECCSESCSQPHPGTNSRCTKSPIRKPCLYDYHCENRLKCGDNWQCCADYWETCAQSIDCCNPEHRCLSALGFVYRKCLYGPVRFKKPVRTPSGSGSVSIYNIKYSSFLTILFTLLITIYNFNTLS